MNQLFVGAVSSGVPVGLIVTLVLIAAAAIAIAVAVYKIKHGIRQISRNTMTITNKSQKPYCAVI